jgi:tetratricopeptide (TPR) repeat protein
MPRRPDLLLTAALLLVAGPLQAQRSGVARAFDLERRGSYADAVEAYRRVLTENPGDVTALLGMERSLTPLSRTPEILPFVGAALTRDSTTGAIYAIGVRAWAIAGQADSLEALVERWAVMQPDEETPYREWGRALLRDHDRRGARRAYLRGRNALGDPSALAAELALLATTEGDYAEAAREWALAAYRLPGYRASALNSLGQAPEEHREEVLQQLHGDTLLVARRLEAELMARWGDPVGAYALFAATLPEDRVQAVQIIRQFLEQLRSQRAPEVRRVQGMAYEDIADLSSGPQAARMRLEAARAYAEGNDQESARRMLASLAGDPQAPQDLVAGATATLIEVLVAEGDVAGAERRLEEFEGGLGGEERLALRREVAWGWMAQGVLDRADRMVASDSSVDGLAVSGYIALFKGDLAGATDLFQQAGPFAGTRDEAAARTSLLALVQPIEADSLPELGAALLLLQRGDTTQALAQLGDVARRLPGAAGGGEVYLLMGKVAVASRDVSAGERWFRNAAATGARASAPAAELELGRLLLDVGRRQEAAEVLEHMIITYGDSALVPQARRLLDQARGGVPAI